MCRYWANDVVLSPSYPHVLCHLVQVQELHGLKLGAYDSVFACPISMRLLAPTRADTMAPPRASSSSCDCRIVLTSYPSVRVMYDIRGCAGLASRLDHREAGRARPDHAGGAVATSASKARLDAELFHSRVRRASLGAGAIRRAGCILPAVVRSRPARAAT